MLRWLDSWPAGLKLNTELSQFYSHSFIDLVALWGGELIGLPIGPKIHVPRYSQEKLSLFPDSVVCFWRREFDGNDRGHIIIL
jgi:hypothetical protein